MRQIIYLLLLICISNVSSYENYIYAKDSSNKFVYKIEYDEYPTRYFINNFAKKYLHDKCNLDMYRSIDLDSYNRKCEKDSYSTGICGSTVFNVQTSLYINPNNESCSNVHSFTECIIEVMNVSICGSLKLMDIMVFSILLASIVIICPLLIVYHFICRRRNMMYGY